MKQIPLSNDTVKRRILDMSNDILDQVTTELESSSSFAIQLDESTDNFMFTIACLRTVHERSFS